MTSIKSKISYCIVSMNRLHHLKETLPVNIIDNEDYENLEFVILDYNSSDSLELYIKETMKDHLRTGRVVFYKTFTPKYFNRSHSRNLAYKLASGDIICNIDADNFTGKKFAEYLNNEFSDKESIFLTFINTGKGSGDNYGKICLRRTDFYRIKGYDERIVSYGFEDYDLINRLELAGVKKKPINKNYALAIKHSHNERLSNEYLLATLNSLYVNYLTPSSTIFLFLYNSNEFKQVTLIDNNKFIMSAPLTKLGQSQLKYPSSFLEGSFLQGNWTKTETEIVLKGSEGKYDKLSYDSEKSCFTKKEKDNTLDFYLLKDSKLIESIVMLFSQINNRLIMYQNKLEKRIVVNDSNFGKALIYKNFDYQNPLSI